MTRQTTFLLLTTVLVTGCQPATAEDRTMNQMFLYGVANIDLLKLTVDGVPVSKTEIVFPSQTEYDVNTGDVTRLSFDNEVKPNKVHFNLLVESKAEGPLASNFGTQDLSGLTVGVAMPHPQYHHVYYQSFMEIEGEQSHVTGRRVGSQALEGMASKVSINGFNSRYVGEVDTYVVPAFPEAAKSLPPLKVQLHWQLPRSGAPDFSKFLGSDL